MGPPNIISYGSSSLFFSGFCVYYGDGVFFGGVAFTSVFTGEALASLSFVKL